MTKKKKTLSASLCLQKWQRTTTVLSHGDRVLFNDCDRSIDPVAGAIGSDDFTIIAHFFLCRKLHQHKFCSLLLPSNPATRMVNFSISNARYTYMHDQKYPSENVDIHHIVLRRRRVNYFFVYASALLVLGCALYLCVLEAKSISILYYSLLFDILLVKLLLRKPVQKESVVIMPAFGVQLETHYMSGKVVRCFVPVDKILKPVLLECVTPVTCYWTLSLLVRGESEMVLVFKNLRPPVKMLVHVWKALCSATCSEEDACTQTQ